MGSASSSRGSDPPRACQKLSKCQDSGMRSPSSARVFNSLRVAARLRWSLANADRHQKVDGWSPFSSAKIQSRIRRQKAEVLSRSAGFEIRVQLGHDGIDCRSVSYSDVPRVRPSELLWLASAIEERDDRCGRELLIVSRGDHE